MRLITSDNDYGKQFSVRKTYLLTLTQVWFFGTVGQPWWQFGHKHRSGSRNRWGPGSCGTEGEGSGKMGIYKSDKCMAFKVWAKLRISCEFQIKLCSILKKFLVISSKMKFMANLHIFYICLYKTMYASIIVMLWSAISGGGGEHFILYTNLSRVYFFQISYKYIEIYMVSMIYNINISYICIFM